MNNLQEKQNSHNEKPNRFGQFVGASKVMRNVYEQIQTISQANNNVLITGEPGSGKALCAQAIHYYANKPRENFIEVDCKSTSQSTLELTLLGNESESAIEQARGGILFLKHASKLPKNVLKQLVKRIRDQKISQIKTEMKSNFNVMCSSDENGTESLLYGLQITPIKMPPLRIREQDILDLSWYFLHQFTQHYQKPFKNFSKSTEIALKKYN